MKKIILWSAGAVLVLGIAVAGFFWLSRPQVVTLSNGTKLTLLGVDYGRHHRFPEVKGRTGRLTRGRGQSSFNTPNDALVVYVLQEHKGNNWPNYQALVCDRAETGCVANWARRSNQIRPGEEIAAIQLDGFPRWDRKFYMRFQSWGRQGQRTAKGQFVISNPARRGSFPRWRAELMPDTQSEGDLDVTLTKFVYGVPGFGPGRRSTKDPANRAVFVAFHTVQRGFTVTNWQPVRIETSDATGNHVFNNSWSSGRDKNGDATMTYQWGLWPDETPWKLRVEMSRTSGFHSNELWTVANVPVRSGRSQDFWNYRGRNQTKTPFAETTIDGFHLKLYPAMQFTDQNFNGEKRGGFHVIVDPPPKDGYRMTLVKATDERGRPIQSWSPSWGSGDYGFQLQNVRNAQFLNLTVALHKSRFVEFTVKPAKP